MGHLSEKAVRRIEEICDSHSKENTPLIMILSDIQNEFGCIPIEVQEIVSCELGDAVVSRLRRRGFLVEIDDFGICFDTGGCHDYLSYCCWLQLVRIASCVLRDLDSF